MTEDIRRDALDQLYSQLAALEKSVGGKRVLAQCDGRMDWPRRGVYFFFEDGELREDGVTPRVVRVGTHALHPSKSTLWGRLAAHRGTVGGCRPGGGNHRGSIFRLHVGTALLKEGKWSDVVRGTWDVGSSARGRVLVDEYPLELEVSQHIRSMPFLWVGVDREPDGFLDRGVIEAGAISLLSNVDREPVDAASGQWLGHRAESPFIGRSGLWNIDHVRDQPSGEFLEVFSRYVEATGAAGSLDE